MSIERESHLTMWPSPEDSWWRLSDRKHDVDWHEGRRRLIERAVRGLRLPPSALVLDVAAGDGSYSAAVASLVNGRLVTQDMSRSASTAAHAAGHRVLRADARYLPYMEQVADVVIAFEFLGYFDPADARRIVGELHRVTKPGGRLLLSTPNRYSLESWKGLARYLATGAVWSANDPSYRTVYSRRALASLLRPGFTVEAWYGYSPVPAIRGAATPFTYTVTTNPLIMTACHKLFAVAKRGRS